jgi:hypothetical protein
MKFFYTGGHIDAELMTAALRKGIREALNRQGEQVKAAFQRHFEEGWYIRNGRVLYLNKDGSMRLSIRFSFGILYDLHTGGLYSSGEGITVASTFASKRRTLPPALVSNLEFLSILVDRLGPKILDAVNACTRQKDMRPLKDMLAKLGPNA